MTRLVLWLVTPGLLLAQPHLQNAQVQTRPVSGSLEAAFRSIVNAQSAPAWIAYAAPLIPGDRNLCCSDGCMLESRESINGVLPGSSNSVHLEGAPEFYVFLRVENRQVEKIHSYSVDCNVDAGGLPLYWLTGVKPAESVALLAASFLPVSIPKPDLRSERRLGNGAMAAIALHRDPSAIDTLLRLARVKTNPDARKQAMVWLARSKDPRATRFFEDVLATR